MRSPHLRARAVYSIIRAMEKFSFLLLLCGTLCLTGCFTVDSAPVKGGGEHVVLHNYGWKFFDWVPLFCGSTEGSGTAFFRDDVTFEKIQNRFVKYANGRPIVCPVFDENDEKFISILGIPFPIPYLFTYKEISLSGTLK